MCIFKISSPGQGNPASASQVGSQQLWRIHVVAMQSLAASDAEVLSLVLHSQKDTNPMSLFQPWSKLLQVGCIGVM